ncbi:signal peptidase I [Candidatus Falkowbacteria bacterium]|mgnify:CR=1 FL=1|jgi:signal peptidase I|nr:signal peptidase I [Candidatus Falkowbacteria bacterium]MBT4433028.1 signal peptidase I [Candidatus Falkowbacteria bacterium]
MQPENKRNFFASIWEDIKESFRPFGSFFGFVKEVVKILVISLAIILPIRWYVIQPFYVKGASMEPTFYTHDYLIINEIGYRFNDPRRGDVVVFRFPRDETQYFIKRVIGLPGERVVISVKENKVSIYNNEFKEGFDLKEEYLSLNEVNLREVDTTLSDNEYFVLGDNRNQSMDSSVFGTVPKKLIIGKAWLRGFPFNRVGVIEGYEYN